MSGENARRGRTAAVAPASCRPACTSAPYIVYIGLGANVGDRRASLKRALRLAAQIEDTRLLRLSSFYETPPWGNEAQPPFLNACAALETRLRPLVLLRFLQRIERALGRVRKVHWGPRTIDIDMLLAEGYTSEAPELRLPHPYLHERVFVLLPLMEITSGLIVRDRPLADWLSALPEAVACRKVSTYIYR